jgi:hypothetical protein
MDTVTYPDAEISRYILEHFVPFKVNMGTREHWPIFRANHIIWTPTVGFMDRNGGTHYLSPGYTPPSEFLAVLKIGRARCLMAWTRSAEAIHELESAAATGSAMTPEVLFWLAAAYFLERRDTRRMWETWERLTTLYPDSSWAKRIYPK